MEDLHCTWEGASPRKRPAIRCGYREPSSTTRELDERNASLFFQASSADIIAGKYLLGMLVGDTRLRAPAFAFLTHPSRTLFKFHYEEDTFASGDDRQLRGGRLK